MMHFRRQPLFSTLHIDWPLFIAIIALGSLGLIILYSAKHDVDLVERQFLRLALASCAMLAIAQIPPRFFKMLAPWLYFGGLVLLFIVLLAGVVAKGGQRWLDLWLIRFQPAELMKVAVPLMLAKYFENQTLPPKFLSLFWPILLIIVPAILVAKQPDLGTAVLIFSAGILVIFFSGISWKLMFSFLLLMALSLPVIWTFMHDYQRQRILTLLDPESDPLGKSYQIIQSKIAIGSGGVWGKGWLNGTQTQLEFLPESSTDTIFAVFGEEFGLVGCLILIIIYLYIIIRGLYIGVQAQDTFSRLLSGGLIMTFFVYIFVNIGMVIGLLPVVGIPLPLVSYGGTSLVSILVSFGILMSIHTHRSLLGK